MLDFWSVRRLLIGLVILTCSVAAFEVGAVALGPDGCLGASIAVAADAPVNLTIVRTDVSPSGKRLNGLLRNDTSTNLVLTSVKVEYLDSTGAVASVAEVPKEQRQAVVRPGETAPWWDSYRGLSAGGSYRVTAEGMPTAAEGALVCTATLQSQTPQADGSIIYRFNASNTTGTYAGQRLWRGYFLGSSGQVLGVTMAYRDEYEVVSRAPGTTYALNYGMAASSPKPTSFVVVCEFLREPNLTIAFDDSQPSADARVVVGGDLKDRAGHPIPGASINFLRETAPFTFATMLTARDGSFSTSMPAPPTGTYVAWTEMDDVAGTLGTDEKVLSVTRRPALLVHGITPGWSRSNITISFADPFSPNSTPTVTPDWTVSYRFLTSSEASASLSYGGEPIVVSTEGSRTIEYWAQDRHAVGEHRFAQVRIDKTAPRTTGTVKRSYRRQAVITMRAADALSGVAATRYRVNSGPWKSGRTIKITRPGKYTLRFYSVDAAGNVESTRSAIFTVTR